MPVLAVPAVFSAASVESPAFLICKKNGWKYYKLGIASDWQ